MNDELARTFDRADWMRYAECAGLDRRVRDAMFFPTRGESTVAAKAVCYSCPVRVECLDYAIANGEHHGIWGGCSERERRAIARSRRLNAGLRPTGGAA